MSIKPWSPNLSCPALKPAELFEEVCQQSGCDLAACTIAPAGWAWEVSCPLELPVALSVRLPLVSSVGVFSVSASALTLPKEVQELWVLGARASFPDSRAVPSNPLSKCFSFLALLEGAVLSPSLYTCLQPSSVASFEVSLCFFLRPADEVAGEIICFESPCAHKP